MNYRNERISDILKYSDKYKHKNELLCKSNTELYYIWESIRCYIEAEELNNKYIEESLFEDYECLNEY